MSLGIFKHRSIDLQQSIKQSNPTLECHKLSENTFLLDNALRIKLLSRMDGKEHLASVTRGIAKGVQGGFIAKQEIDVDFVQEKLYCEWSFLITEHIQWNHP